MKYGDMEEIFPRLNTHGANQEEEAQEVIDGRTMETVREKETKKALNRLKSGKPPSNDNITPEIMKYMEKEIINKLKEKF